MRALLAAALLATQPEPQVTDVHGVVLRHDGTAAGDARVELRCGSWRQVRTVAPDGTFAFAGVPTSDCVLVAQAPDDPSAGASLDLPFERDARVSVILPAGIAARSAGNQGLQLDLRASDTLAPPADRTGHTTVTGLASSSSGLHPLSPVARPDQWSVGATVSRPGPWGTLLQGTVTARRQTGASTLLSDVTGVPAPGGAMWSGLFDPTRSTMIWDVRLGLQKTFGLRGTDITVFGEAYHSFQGAPNDVGALPVPETATKGLRSGTAGRAGLRFGF